MDAQRAELIEEHIEECRHRIGVIENFVETNKDADENNCCQNVMRLKTVISALKELLQYRQIGTVNECYGYKIHSQNISTLNSCNDCGKKGKCTIMPRYGETCRINCYWWEDEKV